MKILPPFYGSEFIMHKAPSTQGMERIDLWRFKSLKSGKTYLVDVEAYENHIYGVKFYLKSQAHKPDRYKFKTNDYEPRRVVMSVMQIMRHYYEVDPYSSFAFIGESCVGEEKPRCKRFRFYRTMVNTYFGQDEFEHRSDEFHSAYLLLRRKAIKCEIVKLKEVETFFKQIYVFD